MPIGDTADGSTVIVAQDKSHRLLCKTNGLSYIPDPVRHVYGVSTRRPLEDWFLDELAFFNNSFPGYEIFTLGSSLVFGERFITYLTVCEFEIETEQDFQNLRKALRNSDQAIRKKFHALWKWDIAARKNNKIAFMVGHLDFAYFLLHRQEFKGKAHTLYMRSFTNERTAITSVDYKVMHDGTIEPFEKKLSREDAVIFENYQRVQFETVTFD
jgi:hypothetical protein